MRSNNFMRSTNSLSFPKSFKNYQKIPQSLLQLPPVPFPTLSKPSFLFPKHFFCSLNSKTVSTLLNINNSAPHFIFLTFFLPVFLPFPYQIQLSLPLKLFEYMVSIFSLPSRSPLHPSLPHCPSYSMWYKIKFQLAFKPYNETEPLQRIQASSC